MNKVDFVAKIAEKSGLTKKDAEQAVNSFIETVSEALAIGEKVQLVGFGTFETRKRAAREGRNPQTGETIVVPESIVPAFKPGNKLKERIK